MYNGLTETKKQNDEFLVFLRKVILFANSCLGNYCRALLALRPKGPWAYWPWGLLALGPIGPRAYWPWGLLAQGPIGPGAYWPRDRVQSHFI